jgi:hypothetical protein
MFAAREITGKTGNRPSEIIRIEYTIQQNVPRNIKLANIIPNGLSLNAVGSAI